MNYRADIDGLRAVAVVAVVLFHAGFDSFSGGFVGVDVFFVISGYLITGIIAREIADGRFSLVHFYERRIRRIFPALFVMLFACMPVAGWLLMPGQLKDFGQSLVAAALSASNMLFWLESGYFDAPAEMKPLLHTWSLAVEEQFYVFLPLLLLAAVRCFAVRLRAIVGAIAAVSFGLSAWLVTIAPSTAFYLLPTRAWELLLGSLLALGAFPVLRARLAREAAGATGLAMIVASVVLFDRTTPFPGTAALLPCLGTALVINAGAGGVSAAGRLLSMRVPVFLGLISYSLYLWHWPLIVFVKQYIVRDLGALEMAAVVTASVVLATASWRFVERPFRHGGRRTAVSRRPVFAAAVGVMSIALVSGAAAHVTGGFPQRLPPEVVAYAKTAEEVSPRRYECHLRALERAERGDPCLIGQPGGQPVFLLWGDSMADAMQMMVDDSARAAGIAGWHASHTGCPPLLGITRADYSPTLRCPFFNDAIIQFVRTQGVKHVLLAARWSAYNPGEPDNRHYDMAYKLKDERAVAGQPDEGRAAFRTGLRRTVAALTEAGAKVWIIKQPPEAKTNDPITIARTVFVGKQPQDIWIEESAHRRRQRAVDEDLRELADEFEFRLVDPAELLCVGGRCANAVDGHALYRDADHLSSFGAAYIQPLLEPVFASIGGEHRAEASRR